MKPTLEMTKQPCENRVVYKVSKDTPRSNRILYALLGVIMILLAVLMVFAILTYNETQGSDGAFVPGVHIDRELDFHDMSAVNPKFAAHPERVKRCAMCCGVIAHRDCGRLTCSC